MTPTNFANADLKLESLLKPTAALISVIAGEDVSSMALATSTRVLTVSCWGGMPVFSETRQWKIRLLKLCVRAGTHTDAFGEAPRDHLLRIYQ